MRLESQGLDDFLEAWEAQPLFASQRLLPQEAKTAQRRLRLDHEAQGLARGMRVLSLSRMPDYRPALARIELPVALVVGELDGKFRALAEDMLALLPHGTLHVIPGVGHNVVLEAPEAVAELLGGDR